MCIFCFISWNNEPYAKNTWCLCFRRIVISLGGTSPGILTVIMYSQWAKNNYGRVVFCLINCLVPDIFDYITIQSYPASSPLSSAQSLPWMCFCCCYCCFLVLFIVVSIIKVSATFIMQEGMAYDLIIGATKIINGHSLIEPFIEKLSWLLTVYFAYPCKPWKSLSLQQEEGGFLLLVHMEDHGQLCQRDAFLVGVYFDNVHKWVCYREKWSPLYTVQGRLARVSAFLTGQLWSFVSFHSPPH